MEMMNYNRRDRNNSKLGIFGFVLFACLGTTMVFYMIKNEPKPKVLGENMYIPVGSENVNENENVDIYSEDYLKAIEYKIVKIGSKNTEGNFKLNMSLPKITIDGEEMVEINDKILAKFKDRYDAVQSQSEAFENKFTYKVTYNSYESLVGNKRVVSFTFYERIIDDSTGADAKYKLYGITIDLATKKIISQDDIAPEILGGTYKNEIRATVKKQLIDKKVFTEDDFTYTMTGLEEFYVRDGKLHIMFNPDELGNKDYIDIVI